MLNDIGLKDFGSVYEAFPGLGMNMIVEFFHSVGVKCRAIQALYMVIKYFRMFCGSCIRTCGLRVSGPGNFFALKP